MLEQIGLSGEDSTDCTDGGVERGFVCACIAIVVRSVKVKWLC